MSQTIQVSGVETDSIVDGPGMRFTVFTQGCPHCCPGCHNPETHSFQGGRAVEVEAIAKEIEKDPLCAGVTLSGGEPLCQPKPLAQLAELVNGMGKNVVCYTGYTWEQLIEQQDPDIMALLRQCKYVIDGPYVQELRTLNMKFRGSSNQRIIDVAASLKEGRAVLADL